MSKDATRFVCPGCSKRRRFAGGMVVAWFDGEPKMAAVCLRCASAVMRGEPERELVVDKVDLALGPVRGNA